MAEAVVYDVHDGVATITLDRPQAANALTAAMRTELLDALRTAATDGDARAVVLTGAGRAFCAGQDLREHADELAAGEELGDNVRGGYNRIARALIDTPKPVIAAVNGSAAGAGASLAFACDLRIAAENASFLMAFARVGLSSDTGAAWTLQRLVGYGRAAQMLLLAEPIDAATAVSYGLVSSVVAAEDLAASADELARRLANGPTAAYAGIKEALNYGATHGFGETLDKEAELQDRLGRTEDHRAATQAFVEKRQPTFHGR